MTSLLSKIDDYVNLKDWRIKENSNVAYSLQGLNNFIISEVISDYWLEKIYPKDIGKLHKEGDFHIHDLGSLSAYCVGWDLYDLLLKGFNGVSGKVWSNPPKHFQTVLGQIVNFFYTLQNETAGAQAFSNFDTLLAPFIYYDNLSYKQVKQYLQEFLFNMNVPTRLGAQSPFTNITMDLVCPDSLKDEYVVTGGELKNKKYGEFQEQMDIFNRAFCEVMIEGDGRGRIFSFPIPTYNITKEFDWENKKLETLWQMTAKYGIPYFGNFINSDMSPDDVRSLCCRLRLSTKEVKRRGGSLFGASPLTGSIGVVTINLPRLGYISKNRKQFYKRLDYLLEKAKQSLEVKREVVERLTEKGLYPYVAVYLEGIKQKTGKYWTNHFSTIGVLGANEMCLNFLGKPIYTEEGKEFAKEVLLYIRKKTEDFQRETGNLYNLEATPAESTCYRLALLDKKKFKKIITAGSEEVPYYTNSSQLPVEYTEDLFEALDNQNELQTIYTGGTVFHVFIGESIEDYNQVKKLVRIIAENYEIPYFTITPTFTICSIHGFIPGEHFTCPYC